MRFIRTRRRLFHHVRKKKRHLVSFLGSSTRCTQQSSGHRTRRARHHAFLNYEGKDITIHDTSSEIASRTNNLKVTPQEKLEEALFTQFKDMRTKNVLLSGEVGGSSVLPVCWGATTSGQAPTGLIFSPRTFSAPQNYRQASATAAAIKMSWQLLGCASLQTSNLWNQLPVK